MNHVEMMQLAEAEAAKSVCKRAQVGAVVLTQWGGRCTGYNHNRGYCCEGADGRTLPTVIHAEADALLSASGFSGGNARGASLYVTRQPCINCAQLIVGVGISAVYYRDADDKTDGIEHLVAHGVFVSSAWLVGESWAERWQEGVR